MADENEDGARPGMRALFAQARAARAGRGRTGAIVRWVGAAASLALFALALFVLWRTLAKLNAQTLVDTIRGVSAGQVLAAAGFTSTSYLALTGYDALALRQLRIKVPYPTTALASFTSYAISFTLGFAMITQATVRYWIYSHAGLSAAKVASLTVVASVTFWLGMGLILGTGLVFDAALIGALNHLDPALNRAIGLGLLALVAAYLVFVGSGRRRWRVQGLKLELPGLGLTCGQIVLGVVDISCGAATLYSLLPEAHGLTFQTFASAYCAAVMLGIASNAPGGIGVFEATMIAAVPSTSQEAIVASLLMFRLVYYLAPFVVALVLLGLDELRRRLLGRGVEPA